jgi:hypothetical protein
VVFCVTTLFGTIVVNPLELRCILHPAITPWQIMSIIRRAGTTAKLLAYALSYVPLAYDLIALAMWRLFQTACVIATPAVCYYFILPYIYDWTHNHLVSSLCMHAPLCCARTRTIVIRTCVGIRDPLRRTKGPTVAQQPREGSSAPRPALWQTQRTRPTDDGQLTLSTSTASSACCRLTFSFSTRTFDLCTSDAMCRWRFASAIHPPTGLTAASHFAVCLGAVVDADRRISDCVVPLRSIC